MTNTKIMIDLWQQAGQSIDDQQRLRIFALLTESEQKKLLDQIRSEVIREPFIV